MLKTAAEYAPGQHTTLPVSLGATNSQIPEWGRWQDVQRLFGIKRGMAYILLAEGKIKGVSLRRVGHLRGCRIFYLPSVATYLQSLLNCENSQ
jgi:hypothetical protein